MKHLVFFCRPVEVEIHMRRSVLTTTDVVPAVMSTADIIPICPCSGGLRLRRLRFDLAADWSLRLLRSRLFGGHSLPTPGFSVEFEKS